MKKKKIDKNKNKMKKNKWFQHEEEMKVMIDKKS